MIAVEINGTTRKGRVGMMRNASDTGILLATPSRFDIGDELSLRLFVSGQPTEIKGRVARIETNPPNSGETWRYQLAIAFDRPLPEIYTLLVVPS